MELIPIFSNVKSFYGKAKVFQDGNIIKLVSYNTIVAQIKDGKATILGWYSRTTARHIKEFLMQYGFEIGTKKQLTKLYCK